MCMSSSPAPAVQPVQPPPPPPQVLKQAAPELSTDATTTGASAAKKAKGTKEFRSSLAIGGTPSSTSSGVTGGSLGM